jgi:hypothetical protein
MVGGNLLNINLLIGRFSTLKMELRFSSETSIHIRTTRWQPVEHQSLVQQISTLKMEVILYSETSIHIRTARWQPVEHQSLVQPILYPEDGGDTFTFTCELHGATSLKMAAFIPAAVRTSNPTNFELLLPSLPGGRMWRFSVQLQLQAIIVMFNNKISGDSPKYRRNCTQPHVLVIFGKGGRTKITFHPKISPYYSFASVNVRSGLDWSGSG